ncbi:MAG: epoxyqueuosine reductase [Bacillota bacterium]|jgi:epoxyqueuosine reductase
MINNNTENKNQLYQELCGLAEEWGGSRFGVANLKPHAELIQNAYGDVWDGYDKAISVAVFFPKQVLNQILDGPTLTYQAYYDIVNARLNDIALRTTLFLEERGYRAFPVPASQRTGKHKESSIFSHRLAGNWAGIGWVGKSLSLVNPDVGPRLRLVTVLTDAPLSTDRPMANRCPANCLACKNACPPGAVKGLVFAEEQPIGERFDRAACAGYLRQVRQSFGKEICGKCLAACPVGRK